MGVDDYAEVNDLKYCGADQRALRGQFVANGFPQDHIFLLDDAAKEAKYRPSKANIERQLGLVLNLIDEDDVFVLAFSGHGVQVKGTSYLCPTEARPAEPDTLISLDRIYEQLSQCSAALKLVMVDACRNDPTLEGQRSLVAGQRAFAAALRERPPEGLVLLNSCGPGEISWEETDFEHGVFMHFVLEALCGAADGDRDGYVTLDELSKYASTKTKVYVTLRFNDSQRPWVRAEGAREALDFNLFRVASSPGGVSRPTVPPLPRDDARPGPKMLVNSIGMKLALIPAGEFQMGSPESEQWRSSVERLHRVRITRPFYMGVHEVTQGEYERIMGENPSYFSSSGGGAEQVADVETGNFPVEQVTRDDAVGFCEKLTGVDEEREAGRRYRLPTEAEWEYACRAGTTTPFHFGNELSGRGANCNGNLPYPNRLSNGPFLRRTTIVGSYAGRANAFGLHDMHGNVREWCSDWYAHDYYDSSPVDDPHGPDEGAVGVFRGGSWNLAAVSCRSADRKNFSPGASWNSLGFRVVCEGR